MHSISPQGPPSPGHRPRKTPAPPPPAHLGLAPARQPFHHSPRLWLRQPQRRLIPESPQKRPLLPRRPRRSGWGNRRRPPRGRPEPRWGRTGPQRRLHLGKGAAQRDDVMRRNGREKMTARATSGRSWGPWLTSLQRDYRFVLRRLLFTSLLPGCTMGNAVPSHGSCLRIPPHDPPPHQRTPATPSSDHPSTAPPNTGPPPTPPHTAALWGSLYFYVTSGGGTGEVTCRGGHVGLRGGHVQVLQGVTWGS